MLLCVYLDDLGANLEGASAELLTGTVGILSVNHADVGTTPGGNHLWRHTDLKMSHHVSK